MDRVTRAMPLSGMVGHPKANTCAWKNAKFDDDSFSCSRDISSSRGV